MLHHMFFAVQSKQSIRTFVIHQNNKTMNDSTEITQELLLRNGWEQKGGYELEFVTKSDDEAEMSTIIVIDCIDNFCCYLIHGKDYIGRHFTTIGELKAIAKALYKVELIFK